MTLLRMLPGVTAVAVLLFASSLPAQNPRSGGQSGSRAQAPQTSRQPQLPPIQKLESLQPDLKKALEDWHESSRQIRELHGEHRRFVYDYTFGTEKRAHGKFYYRSPDHGRIDLLPLNPPPKTKQKKKHPGTGMEVEFTARPESTTQRWICDGERIMAIDDDAKTAEEHPLPDKARGEHIMDGPLPFLFGMPPEKAVNRYYLRLEGDPTGKKHYAILVVPRWRQDAANYRWARIHIEKSTMLPMAVQLMDPARTRETVFTFPKVTKNPRSLNPLRLFGGGDPFRPNLSRYKIQRLQAQLDPPGKKLVPSVEGFDYREAQKIMERSGYRVTFHRGEPASHKQLVYRVAKQNPQPKTELPPNGVVRLTLFTQPISQTGGERPANQQTKASGIARCPNLSGLYWKDAEKHLKAAGIKVRFLKGKLAQSKKDYFRVYAQSPQPGTAMKTSEAVTLTLYVTPEIDAARKKPPVRSPRSN